VKDSVTAPFGQCRDRVRSEWIDENNHMNLGYYVVAFDWATDLWFDHMGFDEAHFKLPRPAQAGRSIGLDQKPER
jgi:hypothetical protein